MKVNSNVTKNKQGNKCTFSIILCVGDTGPWLAECLNSILNQTYTRFELLVAFNNTGHDLKCEFEKLVKNDKRVKIFQTNISQLAFNLNYLVNEAKGSHLVRMDSDDICKPNRLEKMSHYLEHHDVDIVGSAVEIIDKDGKILRTITYPLSHEKIVSQLPIKTVFCHPSTVIKKSFLLKCRGYCGGLHSEDLDLWIRANENGATFGNTAEVLLKYRIHQEQVSGNLIGYSETASYWLRQFLINMNFYNLKGMLFSIFKALVRKFKS